MTPPNKTPPETPKALKVENPATHYDMPQDVLDDTSLSDKLKKKALENWEVDAQALQRAADEGMTGGEPSKLIDVVDAMETIGEATHSPLGVTTKTPKPTLPSK